LREIADGVASQLRECTTEEDQGRLRNLGDRLETAIRHGANAASALAPQADPLATGTVAGAQGYLASLEEERRRLARDIHDGPAQVLANAHLELQYCERLLDRDPGALRQEFAVLQKCLREGLAEVRRLIFDLRPPALVELGLAAALRHYLADFEARTGLETMLSVGGEERLNPAQEAAAFRIVQEALQNVRRHARASRVEVQLETGPEAWRILVHDDGVGFDPAQGTEGRRTLGLTSMRERAQAVGASLEVSSAPGNGTTVALTLPLSGPMGRD
jgi:two-component system sensor histidine kinase DegS